MGETRTVSDGIHHHPFSDSIMSVLLPEEFQHPAIEKYDGLSDPEEHLAAFNAHMLLYGDIATHAIKCRAFPATLTKYALRWFFTLPPNSINNFSDLSAKFLGQHALCKAFRKSPRVLFRGFRQRPDEPLREYINRFNQIAVQIDGLPPQFAIRYVEEGLNPGGFDNFLLKKPAQNLHELWESASYYIDWEDEEDYKRRNTHG